jgi:hypothetical protein
MHTSHSRAVFVIKTVLAIVFALVLWGLQVTPEGAASNASAWAHWFGFSDVPGWFTKEQTDQYLTLIVAALLVGTILWILWPTLVGLLAWAEGRRISLRLERVEAPARPVQDPDAASLSKSVQSCFTITTGEAEPFFSTKGTESHLTERTFKLKLENIDNDRAVTDVAVHVLSVDPLAQEGAPWELESGFSLAAGAHRFIPLASYVEGDSRSPLHLRYGGGASFFEVLSKNRQPKPPKGIPQFISIRATGVGTAPCDYRCKVWVDRTDGCFRIAHAPSLESSPSIWVLLPDAMRELYEATLSSAMAEAARLNDASPGGILRWYANWSRQHGLLIYGTQPPSVKLELISEDAWRGRHFTDDARGVIENYATNPTFVNLSVKRQDLQRLWPTLTSDPSSNV